ncbi:hypothetical protein CAPTEDRAFT_227879 [Capitella teleta]|uniref:Gamma-tubulin complex component n=1 Tax=Capitella teleta TaxID=283909 RepID=R7VGZ5_CAPTE|nr:hypothetical protein CAPTEDRAFT_227879 [Capitella teleta]|eukprot:ELU14965.1 hypothetical protein CAPTEDRAFT_227879 [Capitella teleta]
MQHFSVMRKVYLMEAGDMMYDFYTAIFEKMRLKESWSDVSFLNICLQGALQHCLSDDLAASLFVDVDETQGNSLKALRIRYNVRFPVNIVINTDSVDTYSQTFAFLMQIKYAKYSIDTLSFSELAERSCDHNSALVHRMHMLRMRLMHFINGLHQYIMTRILHSTAMEFQRDVQSARDLQDVLVSHQRYLTRIHDRCLLHQRAQFIHQIVIKILNMALVFAGSWQQGITTVSLKSLKSLEEEFSKCLQFLSSFLNNYMKRGSFPHLESFAFGLFN